MCRTYLGHLWLRLPCCQARCQSRCRGQCYGRDFEGLRKEERDRGLFKGLTKVFIFSPWHLWLWLVCYSTRTLTKMNQCHTLVPAHLTSQHWKLQKPEYLSNPTETPDINVNHKREKGQSVFWCNVWANFTTSQPWATCIHTVNSKSWNNLLPSLVEWCLKYHKPKYLIKGQLTNDVGSSS